MKKYKLCKQCDESEYCVKPCDEAINFTDTVLDDNDRIKGKYKTKGVPLVSYRESRLTKNCNNNPLDFN